MSDPDTQKALLEMSRALGGLESSVKTLTATWQQQEQAASQGRKELHQKFDGINDKVLELSKKVDVVVKEVAEIKPSVEDFEKAREQARGAGILGGKLGALVAGGVTAVSGLIVWLLSNWTITPKH